MAWRPSAYLLEGELDNTTPGKVTGWARFAGMSKPVSFDLKGDFHRDIRRAKIHFVSDGQANDLEAAEYMAGFTERQVGNVGDITAGLPPHDYGMRPYLEWYGDDNGRVVLELDPAQVRVIGQPIPAIESDPISREDQARNMTAFLGTITQELALPAERAVCVGMAQPKSPQTEASGPGMELLPEEIRRQIPPLGGQDDKGGDAVVHARFFTPWSSWTWSATEGAPEGDDFMFFGLVEGLEKELGYFSLSELQSVRGPLGLRVERDLYWQPKTLRQIAPELFEDPREGGH